MGFVRFEALENFVLTNTCLFWHLHRSLVGETAWTLFLQFDCFAISGFIPLDFTDYIANYYFL